MEACEYDRTFLQLAPTGAIVTNLEADHLDCYGSFVELERAFCRFVNSVDPQGLVVLGADVPDSLAEASRAPVLRMGIELHADLVGESRGVFRFGLRGPGWATPPVQLSAPGRFNVDNAALAVALAVGLARVAPASAARGVSEYPGAARRFEPWGEPGGVPIVHDYAHHPTELRVTLETASERSRGASCTSSSNRTRRAVRPAAWTASSRRCAGCTASWWRTSTARKHIDRMEGADAETLVTRLRRAGVDAVVGEPPEAAMELCAGLTKRSAAFVLGAATSTRWKGTSPMQWPCAC